MEFEVSGTGAERHSSRQRARAADECAEYFQKARQLLHRQQWGLAAKHYCAALEEFENLPEKVKAAQCNRYLRIALEFTYALRMGDARTDLPALVAIVRCYVARKYRIDTDKALQPIEDIAFSPKAQARYWMTVLFAMEESQAAVKQ